MEKGVTRTGTSYRHGTSEGLSDPWVLARGLREGDPSSPVLFEIYHQVVMRVAADHRKRKAEEAGLEIGIREICIFLLIFSKPIALFI